MRESIQTKSYSTAMAYQYRPNGWPVETNWTGTSVRQEKLSQRSTVQKTSFDSTGWRPPTPYVAAFDEVVQPWVESPTFEIWHNDPRYPGEKFRRYWRISGDPNAWTGMEYCRLMPLEGGCEPFPSWLVQRAINRAYADLKDSTVNYAVALAEAGKAADLVASTSRQLLTAYRSARKGNMKAAARALGVLRTRAHKRRHPVKGNGRHARAEMSRRWLELNYGWMPLLSDIHGVIEDFKKGFIREPRIAVTKESKITTNDFPAYQKPRGSIYNGSIDRRNKHVAKVRMDFVLDSTAFQQLAQKGVTNPLLVAWELLPYSFVVDWFAPIGEFLETLDATLGMTWKGGSVTTYTVSDLKYRAYYVPGYFQGEGRADAVVKSAVMNRSVLKQPPSAGLYIKNPFSVSHALSGLALLNQALTGRRRSSFI